MASTDHGGPGVGSVLIAASSLLCCLPQTTPLSPSGLLRRIDPGAAGRPHPSCTRPGRAGPGDRLRGFDARFAIRVPQMSEKYREFAAATRAPALDGALGD